MKSVFVGLLVCTLITTSTCSLQSVGIKGVLKCGNQVVKNVDVKLVDVNLGRDETMAQGKTDRYGEFLLVGSATERSTIDPILKIYHDCNDGITRCQRKWKLQIPSKYVTRGRSSPSKIMDLGIVNMEIELMNEEHDCIH